MPACVFCQIAASAVPAALVYETPTSLAFLDHRPVFKGHILLIPRAHVATLPDLPADQIAPLFQAAQHLARAVEVTLQADGSFVAMNNRVSQSVPHLHVHVIPRRRGDGLRGFFWPRIRYQDDAELADYAARLRAAALSQAALSNSQ